MPELKSRVQLYMTGVVQLIDALEGLYYSIRSEVLKGNYTTVP